MMHLYHPPSWTLLDKSLPCLSSCLNNCRYRFETFHPLLPDPISAPHSVLLNPSSPSHLLGNLTQSLSSATAPPSPAGTSSKTNKALTPGTREAIEDLDLKVATPPQAQQPHELILTTLPPLPGSSSSNVTITTSCTNQLRPHSWHVPTDGSDCFACRPIKDSHSALISPISVLCPPPSTLEVLPSLLSDWPV